MLEYLSSAPLKALLVVNIKFTHLYGPLYQSSSRIWLIHGLPEGIVGQHYYWVGLEVRYELP